MKFRKSVRMIVLSGFVGSLAPNLVGATVLQVEITNGSSMPISPGVLYFSQSQEGFTSIGQAPSSGFITLCQTGNADPRLAELQSNSAADHALKTTGPIFPGQSATVSVQVSGRNLGSLHFEAMYGKTKDVCSVLNVKQEAVRALASGYKREIFATDTAVATGAFSDPLISPDLTSAPCEGTDSAPGCLRQLSAPKTEGVLVRAFSGYLPSVLTAIEGAFGASEAQSLLIPSSGAVKFKVTRSH